MSISNYGIKIYAINEKKNNEIVLMDLHKSILNAFLKSMKKILYFAILSI